jgi:hypothetical protein
MGDISEGVADTLYSPPKKYTKKKKKFHYIYDENSVAEPGCVTKLSEMWVGDSGSRIRKKPIPDPGSRGVKEAPDPGSATLDGKLSYPLIGTIASRFSKRFPNHFQT